MKCSLGISNFLEEISSLSHAIVFLYFFALIAEEGFLISPCYSLELCIQMGISFFFFLCFLLPLFSQLFVRPPQTAILLFCISFSWGWSWSLSPVHCHEPPSIVHQTLCPSGQAECQRIDAFDLWLKETLESPLDSKEIKPVNLKGNQSWIFIGKTDGEAEAPVLWLPDVKNWLIAKDTDAGKDWRQKEKGTAEDEMVVCHHWLSGHEFEQALGVGDRQGNLECCSPWGRKELDMTERLNWTEPLWLLPCWILNFLFIPLNDFELCFGTGINHLETILSLWSLLSCIVDGNRIVFMLICPTTEVICLLVLFLMSHMLEIFSIPTFGNVNDPSSTWAPRIPPCFFQVILF